MGHSAMVVEEDSMGFTTIEVGDKHTGPQGLGIWSCRNITRVRRGPWPVEAKGRRIC